MVVINVPNDNEENIKEFFTDLLKLVYQSYQISYVKHNKKNYFNCTNMWCGGKPKNTIKYCHKDHKCDGYWDCILKKSNIIVNNDKLKYFFEMGSEFDGETIHPLVKQILDHLESGNNDITLKSNQSIKLINNHGINNDHRGSDHTLIELPFYSNVELGNTFEFDEFVKASFEIKSHKFDFWYELYCGVNKIQMSDNSIYVHTNFDHGS